MAGWWYGCVCSQIGNPLIPPGNMIAVNWDMHHVHSGETGAAETVLWWKWSTNLVFTGRMLDQISISQHDEVDVKVFHRFTWMGNQTRDVDWCWSCNWSRGNPGKSHSCCNWLVLIGTWNCWSCLMPDSITLKKCWLDNSHVFNIAWRRLKSLYISQCWISMMVRIIYSIPIIYI